MNESECSKFMGFEHPHFTGWKIPEGIEFTHTRRLDAMARVLVCQVEAASILAPSSWNTGGGAEIRATPIEAGFESVFGQIESGDSAFTGLKITVMA